MCETTDLMSTLAVARISVFTAIEPKKALAETRQWFKRLDDDFKAYRLAMKLKPYWPLVPQALLLSYANQVDMVFLKTMLWIYENDGEIPASEAMRMWRRLKAINQFHILTYIRQANLLEHIKKDPRVTSEIIIGLCFQTAEALSNFNNSWTDSRAVDYAIREKLGISLKSDVKVAFKKWCVINHPDKGGDHNEFCIVNAMYEEYQEAYGTSA